MDGEPSHYILIGQLQVIIGSANIRQGCRIRRPKEKMANPDARTSKRELGLHNYLKSFVIIRDYRTMAGLWAGGQAQNIESDDEESGVP